MNDLKAIHKTVIAVFFLGTIALLQALGKQTESFVTVGLLVLAGLGFVIGKVEAVQKQTNGGQEKLIQVIEDRNRRDGEILKLVAGMTPAPTVLDGTVTTTTTTATEGAIDGGEKSLVESR